MSPNHNGPNEGPMKQASELINQAFGLVIAMTSLRLAFEMGLEEKMPLEGNVSAEELAQRTGADVQLIVRTLRPLLSMGIFKEVEPHVYQHTPLSLAFKDPRLRGYMQVGWDRWLPVYGSLHKWFKQNNFQLGQEATSTPFASAHGAPLFDYLSSSPAAAMVFNASMEHLASPVAQLFPWASRFSPHAAGDGIQNSVLVDVGGGKGQGSREILEECAALANHIVVQDQMSVLNEFPTELRSRVETVSYDFFKPQPIKAASFYYMRNILCDWPDSQCIEIMRNQVSATCAASRFLLATRIMPETGADSMTAAMDICMLTYGGTERTAKQYEGLIAEAGLVVEKTWTAELCPWGIIEARLEY